MREYLWGMIIGTFAVTTVLNTAMASENTAKQPWDQWGVSNPSWVEDMTPYKMIGNIHYVGTKGIASFLITSDKGHVLIDGGLPQNAQLIADNIKALGFDLRDVKILLNSHAHFDHSGGLAALKTKSGARLIASEGDRSALEGGFYLGAEDILRYTAPPVSVDQIIGDGETVQLGNITLTASITPGHTRGCTSWGMRVTEQNVSYDALFFCSATVAGNRLNPPQYEGIVEDYRKTFQKTRDWRPDVFFSNHPSFFDMDAKRTAQLNGNTLAFIDRKGFPEMMQGLEKAFEASLETAMQTQPEPQP
ncbi:MAG: subclass B3 metallo-beta-lactamase [Robiginitomaculum sp.]|nr:MAG: subclass B3 metallo-beta-lactamase [Robiginitomaculum sp.]